MLGRGFDSRHLHYFEFFGVSVSAETPYFMRFLNSDELESELIGHLTGTCWHLPRHLLGT